jgi:hypothetical protein
MIWLIPLGVWLTVVLAFAPEIGKRLGRRLHKK